MSLRSTETQNTEPPPICDGSPTYSLPFRHPYWNCFPFQVFSFMLYALLPFSLFAVITDYPIKSKKLWSPSSSSSLHPLFQAQTLTTDELHLLKRVPCELSRISVNWHCGLPTALFRMYMQPGWEISKCHISVLYCPLPYFNSIRATNVDYKQIFWMVTRVYLSRQLSRKLRSTD